MSIARQLGFGLPPQDPKLKLPEIPVRVRASEKPAIVRSLVSEDRLVALEARIANLEARVAVDIAATKLYLSGVEERVHWLENPQALPKAVMADVGAVTGKPWEAEGVSKATWYRNRKAKVPDLLKSPANAARLRRSLADANAGKLIEREI